MKVKKVKKSLFHFSGKSLKVKKVKSESDYFSLSNVCPPLTILTRFLFKKDKYVLGSIGLLCTINAWHAIISLIDDIDLWPSFDGYKVHTWPEHQAYLSQMSKPAAEQLVAHVATQVSLYNDTRLNQTMVRLSVLTPAQRCDRYALFFFASLYICLHVVFGLYMYFCAYKRRRLMETVDREYLVNRGGFYAALFLSELFD